MYKVSYLHQLNLDDEGLLAIFKTVFLEQYK